MKIEVGSKKKLEFKKLLISNKKQKYVLQPKKKLKELKEQKMAFGNSIGYIIWRIYLIVIKKIFIFSFY